MLLEDYNEDMKTQVMSSLLSIKANKGDNIPTKMLVKQLNDLGYSCTIDSIVSLLSDMPMVTDVNAQMITLGDGDDQFGGDEMGKDEHDDAVMDNLIRKGANN